MIPLWFEAATASSADIYGTPFHNIGTAFHLCQDEEWSKKHAAANEGKNRSQGIALLRCRSSSWTAAEKAV